MVLTSGPGIISSIGWEASPIENVLENESPEMKLAVSLADVPEDGPLDELSKVNKNE